MGLAMSTAFPRVLVPFHVDEAICPKEAAGLAGNTERTIRLWCEAEGVGRRIGGRWRVSKVALLMLLEGDRRALAAYHAGDRRSPLVQGYYRRAGVADVLPALQTETSE
jgi:hypothetical protein